VFLLGGVVLEACSCQPATDATIVARKVEAQLRIQVSGAHCGGRWSGGGRWHGDWRVSHLFGSLVSCDHEVGEDAGVGVAHGVGEKADVGGGGRQVVLPR
jgi:hypothetical protein